MKEKLDKERLLDTEPVEIIVNPVARQEWLLLERDSDSDGGFLRYEIRYQPDAKHFAGTHVHPKQQETFKVISGEYVVTVDGSERILGEDEEVTVPAGVPHFHRNPSGTETRVLVDLRPLLVTEAFYRGLAGLAQDGETNDDGVPNLLAFAVLADTYSDIAYPPTPPIVVQKLLYKLLAPVGRLRGYSADYPSGYHAESG